MAVRDTEFVYKGKAPIACSEGDEELNFNAMDAFEELVHTHMFIVRECTRMDMYLHVGIECVCVHAWAWACVCCVRWVCMRASARECERTYVESNEFDHGARVTCCVRWVHSGVWASVDVLWCVRFAFSEVTSCIMVCELCFFQGKSHYFAITHGGDGGRMTLMLSFTTWSNVATRNQYGADGSKHFTWCVQDGGQKRNLWCECLKNARFKSAI